MTIEESIERYGLVPSDESLPAIRRMLAGMIARNHAERQISPRGNEVELTETEEYGDDLHLLCCVQLFSRAYLEDVLLIWAQKQSSFDSFCYIDVEHMCGAGLEETKQFLRNHPAPEATAALHHVESCEVCGEKYTDWSPSSWLQQWKEYFRVA